MLMVTMVTGDGDTDVADIVARPVAVVLMIDVLTSLTMTVSASVDVDVG